MFSQDCPLKPDREKKVSFSPAKNSQWTIDMRNKLYNISVKFNGVVSV